MIVIIQRPSVNISKTINLNSKHIKHETFPILFESSLSSIKKNVPMCRGAYKPIQVDLTSYSNYLKSCIFVQVFGGQILWTS